MSWYVVSAAGASRDLWVVLTGEGRPEYGRWITPAGVDVARTLGREGPPAVGLDVWWEQGPEHPGRRLTDFVWETGLSGLKLVSERMLEVLTGAGGRLTSFDADVRLRSGETVGGYVAVLEQSDEAGPVHSLWRGRRAHSLVVSEEVRMAIGRAGLTGLDIEEVAGPFPGDAPGYFDD